MRKIGLGFIVALYTLRYLVDTTDSEKFVSFGRRINIYERIHLNGVEVR